MKNSKSESSQQLVSRSVAGTFARMVSMSGSMHSTSRMRFSSSSVRMTRVGASTFAPLQGRRKMASPRAADHLANVDEIQVLIKS